MSSPDKSSPDKLVYMANQIGKFFRSQGPDEAVAGIAEHIKKFWDPRMRNAIHAYLDAGGQGLDPCVCKAVMSLRTVPDTPKVTSPDNSSNSQPAMGSRP